MSVSLLLSLFIFSGGDALVNQSKTSRTFSHRVTPLSETIVSFACPDDTRFDSFFKRKGKGHGKGHMKGEGKGKGKRKVTREGQG